MSEAKRPQWVRCGDCNHKWIGFYAPIEVSKMTRIIGGMFCPKCAAAGDFSSKSIFIPQENSNE